MAQGTTVLEVARAAHARHAWQEAFAGFAAAEEQSPLGPADLEAYADCAHYVGRTDSNRYVERALDAYRTAGDDVGVARMALVLARNHFFLGEDHIATGWWTRAVRHLDGVPEGPEHAAAAYMEGHALSEAGDVGQGLEIARRAAEIARRTGNLDIEALALDEQAHSLLVEGDVRGALALFDEATALAVSGRLAPWAAGNVLCSAIWACRMLGDWSRAAQLTDVSLEYCDRETAYFYPGLCRVHRAEIIRLRGEYDTAERDIVGVCDELLALRPKMAGWAFQELGEVRLRRGDFDAAMDAFRRAVELGVEPQPGLARLRLAQGDAPSALRALERALADPALGVSTKLAMENRPYLLPAIVSVAIGAGDLDRARAALAELETLGPLVESAAHRASLLAARGEVALAEDRAADAIGDLRHAVRAWLDVDAPYEAAQVRMWLACAYEADGDRASASLELEAAAATFERLGAAHDAAVARRRLGATPDERTVRTFLWTDIVDSTRLLDVLGDADWSELLRWHDRVLRACFARHDGQEIKHEGDGFFVAFTSPYAALSCAIGVQRALAEHRRDHGFAPRVRIGVHEAEATRYDNDYAGRGVHESARIASVAGADEVLVSTMTLAGDPRFKVREARALTLKGLSQPVDAVVIDWRE